MRKRKNKRRRRKLPPKARKRKLRQNLKLTLKIFIIILILVFVAWLSFSDFLKIDTISCQLDQKACQDIHLQTLNQYKSSHLLLLKPTKIEEKLLNQDQLLASAQVISKFPNHLQVKLHSQENTLPIGIISYHSSTPPPTATATATPTQVSTDSPNSTVSAQATSSATPSPASTPQVIKQRQAIQSAQPQVKILTSTGSLIAASESDKPKAYLLSSTSDHTLLKSFYRLYQELILSGITPKVFWLFDDHTVLFITPSLYTKLPLNDQPGQIVATLQQIRSQSTINLNRVIIDLRFNQPVVSDY